LNEATDKLAEALALAQGAFVNPPKDRENPYFKSRYATLDALQNATRKALSENGLSITQGGSILPEGWVLETTLRHASGQSLTSRLPLLAFAKGPQAAGSEITYMRRYAYAAILNIAADEDDDANGANDAQKPQAGTTKEYTLHPPRQQAEPPPPANGDETIEGTVGSVTASNDGKCWFLSIGDTGTKGNGTIWTRDEDLANSLMIVKDPIVAHVRSKTPGKYQIISFVPAGG
jgi:hypothetical protein